MEQKALTKEEFMAKVYARKKAQEHKKNYEEYQAKVGATSYEHEKAYSLAKRARKI